MTRIYHQLGFRANWSIESLETDGAGDGLILAPRYQSRQEVEALKSSLRSCALFDPQFFVPGTSRGRLSTYDFFPDQVTDGFVSSEYDHSSALTSAQGCVSFQQSAGFERIVIPTRYLNIGAEDYIDSQSRLFVDPFLTACATGSTDKPILLQLVLSERILKDPRETTTILNWVTGLPELAGCYLIPNLLQRDKQLKDPDFLLGLLEFIDGLRGNKMEAIVGYLNTEALMLLASDPTGLATGAYENLRMFSTRAFEEDEGREQRGPSARLFISHLLQWIDYRYLGALDRALSWNSKSIDPSNYTPVMVDSGFNWNFQKPEIYKHYFAVFMPLLKSIGELPLAARRDAIRERIDHATELFSLLEHAGVVLDAESDGSHLKAWLTALNLFRTTL